HKLARAWTRKRLLHAIETSHNGLGPGTHLSERQRPERRGACQVRHEVQPIAGGIDRRAIRGPYVQELLNLIGHPAEPRLMRPTTEQSVAQPAIEIAPKRPPLAPSRATMIAAQQDTRSILGTVSALVQGKRRVWRDSRLWRA